MEKYKWLFLQFITLIWITGLFAGGPDTLWTKTYGGTEEEEGYCVRQTEDGGYIIAGRTESFGPGYFDLWLLKTDADGDTLWTRTFGGTEGDGAYSVQQTEDGGYIIAGYTWSFDIGYGDAWLLKTGAFGDTVWAKTYGSYGSEEVYSVQQTSDGGYIMAGVTFSTGGGEGDCWLIKTDSDGDTMWTRVFGGPKQDFAYSVQQTFDGGYIMTGFTGYEHAVSEADVWLIKTDGAGIMQWEKKFGGPDSTVRDEGRFVQQTSDGGYIITGWTLSYGAGWRDVWLIKTDASGDTFWTRTFGGTESDYGYCVQQTFDGGYVVCGHTASFDERNGGVWLIKTDGYGDTLWTRTYDEIGSVGYFVEQTEDGGYIITGERYEYGQYYDVLLIKTKSDIWINPTSFVVTIPAGESIQQTLEIGNNSNDSLTYNITESPPVDWLWVGQGSGSVPPRSTEEITITFDASTLIPNTYQTTLIINTDVPGYEDIEIPMELTVVSNVDAPIISTVDARYDGDSSADTVGRFISTISLMNTFTATVTDPQGSGNINRVIFSIEGDSLVDTTPADGWEATFNMRNYTGKTRLVVMACDEEDHLSNPYILHLDIISIPSWLATYLGYGGVFYFDYDEECYKTDPLQYVPSDFYEDYTVPSDVLLLGDRYNGFGGGVRFTGVVPLDKSSSSTLTPGGGIEFIVLSDTLFHVGSDVVDEYFEYWFVLNGATLEIDSLVVSLASAITLAEFPIPEVRYSFPFTVSGVPMEAKLELGGDIAAELEDITLWTDSDFHFAHCQVVPQIVICIDLTAAIEVAFGVAEVALVGHPTATLGAIVDYPPVSIDFIGAFVVPYELVGSLGWGLASGTLYSDTLGPWDFGTKGFLWQEMLYTHMRDVNIPDVLPQPDLASDNYGDAILVWIGDEDTLAGSADPEVYYSYSEGGDWASPMPIVNNDAILETSPRVTFTDDEHAIAVWVGNATSSGITDLQEVLSGQEIYYATWDGEWSASSLLTDNSYADGLPRIAGTNGKAMAIWTETYTNPLDRGTWEVVYSLWDGTSWTSPDYITGDYYADCGVDVAYSSDHNAIAVWLKNTSNDFSHQEATEVYFSWWSGSSWSYPRAITSNSVEERDIACAFDTSGNAVVVWVESSPVSDRLLYAIIEPSGSFTSPALIDENIQFIQSADITVNDNGRATCMWRGYKGYDGEIFSSYIDGIGSKDEWSEGVNLTDDRTTDWYVNVSSSTGDSVITAWVKWEWTPDTTSPDPGPGSEVGGGIYAGGMDPAVGIEEMEDDTLQDKGCKFEIYPNPIVKVTLINYYIPVRSTVSMRIYDVMGREIRTLVNRDTGPGQYRVIWDRMDDSGKEVSNGVYFLRFEAGGFISTRKMILIK